MRWHSSLIALLILLAPIHVRAAAPEPCPAAAPFGAADPANAGVDPQKLLDLTQWVRDSGVPIMSLLVSRRGRLVYALYSADGEPDAAHYVMSVTKSVTSALAGAAIDRGLLAGPDQAVADAVPRALLPDQGAAQRLRGVTLRQVLAMSALDAKITPHFKTPEAAERQRQFRTAPNRLKFALAQDLLPRPGTDFQYTDVTPIIVGGAIQYAAGRTLLDFAREALFDPMGFENVEWMHADASGIDNASYGLRLRPIDMQKFGILFLEGGCWQGRRLLSRAWVQQSLTAWIRTAPQQAAANYGWYWWTDRFQHGWVGTSAAGWKGQRISVFAAQGVVVTMTAIVEDGDSNPLYARVINAFVAPAVPASGAPPLRSPDVARRLAAALEDVRQNKRVVGPRTEARMVPSAAPKERHPPFRP